MGQTRHLAAILFTDIVGYTALMGRDEQQAFSFLEQNRELHRPVITRYNGRIVKELGDGIMASFQTVSDAVQAAIEIMQACYHLGAFSLRMGIHHGEVVSEDDDLFGDAVNIAARIQSAASPGQLWISESVQVNIANKGIATRFAGTPRLKNVKEPLRLYQVVIPGIKAPAGGTRMPIHTGTMRRWMVTTAILLVIIAAGYFGYTKLVAPPGKNIPSKSIAVLPFRNLSNDREQEYFSDGLSEELLNMLSKVKGLKVTGRSSAFFFKNKNEDPQTIGEKLGVAHLLDGSVRRSGNQVRIMVQLISTRDGTSTWTRTFEKTMNDIFALQDEIATSVAGELELKLIQPHDTTEVNVTAYDLMLQGTYYLNKLDQENVEKALDAYQRALSLDSSSGRLWGMLGGVYARQAWQNYIDQDKGYEMARVAAMKAIRMSPDDAAGYSLLSAVKLYHDFDWAGAEAALQQGLKLEPENIGILKNMGVLEQVRGQWKKALVYTNKAITLDPLRPILYSDAGACHTYLGDYAKAEATYRKLLQVDPRFQRAHLYLGRLYLLQNKYDRALEEMEQENMPFFKTFGLLLAEKKMPRQGLQDFIAKYQHQWPYLIAELCAWHGDREAAFVWLERAIAKKDAWLTWIKGDPLLKSIHA
ncbi:MAG TPA: adenylate/guanylate cyclase domain-containing protein, partial [Flavisolibacter sp.]